MQSTVQSDSMITLSQRNEEACNTILLKADIARCARDSSGLAQANPSTMIKLPTELFSLSEITC
jgi:hypothetical protein